MPYEGSGQDRRREQTVMSQSFDTASMNRQHSFVNQLIRENSQQTAVVLTYLPPPPVDPSGHGQYLTDIRALSGERCELPIVANPPQATRVASALAPHPKWGRLSASARTHTYLLNMPQSASPQPL